MSDDERTQLVLPPVTDEDHIQVVIAPQLRPRIEEYFRSLGLEYFQIPCEAGTEDDDLPTFGLRARR